MHPSPSPWRAGGLFAVLLDISVSLALASLLIYLAS